MNSHVSQSLSPTCAIPPVWRAVLLSLLAGIVLLCLSLFWPVFHWFILKMSLANGWLHILAFAGLCSLGLYRLSRLPSLPVHFPEWAIAPVLLWLPAGVIYLLNEAHVGFNTLSAALFVIFIYGLSGHIVDKSRWLSLFIPTLLLILVLPFEHYLDIYLGFPLRLLSAQWASSILQLTGLPLLTTESILVIDNRAAVVDLDCSGIKSLWIGLIFYLLLTWIERYRLSWCWWLVGLFYIFLLVLANVARITLLVVLELVLGLPEIAAMLHQSLGLVGFGVASVAVWWVLRIITPHPNPSPQGRGALSEWHIKPPRPQTTVSKETSLGEGVGGEGVSNREIHLQTIISTFIFLTLLTLNLLYTPYTKQPQATLQSKLELPTYQLTQTTLNPQEQTFFTSNQAQANKYRLTLPLSEKSVEVAMVNVWSRAWKTHHVPENCYLSQGFSINEQGVWQHPDFAMRYLKLNQPQASNSAPLTAVYWFQSADSTSPDYSARVIDNLYHPGRTWVMVSILFDGKVTPAQITPFLTDLKLAIGKQFHEN